MLYEVTGMRLRRDEFWGEQSSDSDSEGDDEQEELLPSDFVMMERFEQDSDDDNG